MIDKIEFSNAKQVRKTLLIISFIGISFESLVKHSTGNIEFFGFKLPVEDATVIPNFIGYLIIYFVIALLIRYADEDLRTKYKNFLEHKKLKTSGEREAVKEASARFDSNWIKKLITRFGLLFIDIFFPVIFALFTLYMIFIK